MYWLLIALLLAGAPQPLPPSEQAAVRRTVQDLFQPYERRPWSETVGPFVTIHKIRPLLPGLVEVRVTFDTYGSLVINRRQHALMVLRKEPAAWRLLRFTPR